MLEGQLMPHTRQMLVSVIGITLIGTKKLPKDWLKSTFRIRRRLVYECLMFLVENNPVYTDIVISHDRLMELPEDGVPDEISAIVRHEPDENIAFKERSGYVPDLEEYSMDIDADGERLFVAFD